MDRIISPGGNVFEGNYKPGDRLIFKPGNYTYFSGANTSGTPDKPIYCLVEKGAVFSAGFNFTNCSNWKIDGTDDMNIVVRDAKGVPLSFGGKCSNIEVIGIDIDGCFSFVWFKSEVDVYKTEEEANNPFVMDGFRLRKFKFRKAGFEGLYLGSTGQDASRSVVIGGKTLKPLPPSIANIQIEDGSIESCSRTGLQVSGVHGVSYLRRVTIKNSGVGGEKDQGASFRIGGNSPDGFEVTDCVFDTARMSNIHSQGGGKIIIQNTKILNSCAGSTEKMAAVWLDSNAKTPATFILKNNEIDASNNNVSVVVYGNDKSVTADSENVNNKLAGQFQNFSGVPFKTTEVPVPPDPDPEPEPEPTSSPIKSFTLDAANKKVIFEREDGTTLVIENVRKAFGTIKNGQKVWQYEKAAAQNITVV